MQDVHVDRDRAAQDLLEEPFADDDVAVPQAGLARLVVVPPQVVGVDDRRVHAAGAALVPLAEADRRAEETDHLLLQAGAHAVAASAVGRLDVQPVHELRQRRAQLEPPALGPNGVCADPCEQQPREVAVGQQRPPAARHHELEGAVRPDVDAFVTRVDSR